MLLLHLQLLDELPVDDALPPRRALGAAHHLHYQPHLLLVGELLVVELPRPDHANLTPLVGEDADQSEHAGLGDESEGEGHWAWHIHEDPGDSPHQEERGSRNQVDPSVPGGVEPPEVGEQHSGEDDGGDGEPRAFLVVGGVEGGELQFDGEVVAVQEEVVVGLLLYDVEDDYHH